MNKRNRMFRAANIESPITYRKPFRLLVANKVFRCSKNYGLMLISRYFLFDGMPVLDVAIAE